MKLSSDCPGGADTFELIANFCYGSTILMEPSNVAALRCAAEYLQMSEDYGRANLCERSDLYISQVQIISKLCTSPAILPILFLCPPTAEDLVVQGFVFGFKEPHF